MSGSMAVGMGRAIGRAALATALLVGIALATGAVQAGAASSATPLGNVGYGYATMGTGVNTGNVYVVNYYSGEILQVGPTGAVTNFANLGTGGPWAITSDGQGDLFADLYYYDEIYEISPTGTVSLYSSNLDESGIYGMAFNTADGYLYVSNGGDIYRVASNGSVSLWVTGAGGDGLAFDAAGNLYSSDETNGDIYRVTPGAVVTTFAVGLYEPFGVAFGPDGDLYVAQAGTSDSIASVTPAGGVSIAVSSSELFSAGSTDLGSVAFNSYGTLFAVDWDTYEVWMIGVVSAPTQLAVSESAAGTVTASWYGTSTDTSYTCTLMYGFNDPSSVSETSSTPSCSFVGLDPSTGYGVRVTASSVGGQMSAPAVAFASPAPAPAPTPPTKHTIVCKKNHKTALRTVTGLHPTCPAGWHRVA